ncbi:MAG: DUF3794 domain-containing protein [Lachnospiraceae bacterium]|nr:DUF3794 domain-containing protein [Lachnospiraceae bacterium]
MDIIKKNIHMGRIRTQASNQVSYEDDLNIPENKPDVSTILLHKGEVEIQEMKAVNDAVHVKGRLLYEILYETKEQGCSLVALEGSMPIEEKILLQGALPTDQVEVEARLEDLTVGMINSRKLNIQAVIQLLARVEELYDEEIPMEVQGEEKVEYRIASVGAALFQSQSNMGIAQLCIRKKDIYRIKEECVLPSNYPNVFQILSYRIKPADMEFRIFNDCMEISGELQLCIVYEGEGEGHPIRAYETSVSFNGKQDCMGAFEGMIPDVLCTLGQKEVTIKPDRDGEERCILLEVCLEQDIRVYEELNLDMITDIYGVHKQVLASSHKGCLQGLLGRVSGKMKLTDHVKLSSSGGILQILCSDCEPQLSSQTISPEGVVLKGFLHVHVVYITGNDETPYGSASLQIPFVYTLEIQDIAQGDQVSVHVQVEQLQISLMDGDEADMKAVLSFQAMAFRKVELDILDGIQITEQDTKLLKELPGFAIYRVKAGDNLWSIGKKYHVSVDSLKRLNNLTSDLIFPGQKLLIMKEQRG